jgi:hypothetical protein
MGLKNDAEGSLTATRLIVSQGRGVNGAATLLGHALGPHRVMASDCRDPIGR